MIVRAADLKVGHWIKICAMMYRVVYVDNESVYYASIGSNSLYAPKKPPLNGGAIRIGRKSQQRIELVTDPPPAKIKKAKVKAKPEEVSTPPIKRHEANYSNTTPYNILKNLE